MATAVAKLTWGERFRGAVALAKQKSWGGGGTGGWVPVIREPFTGAWQKNITVSNSLASANWAVFSCVTLIANDMAKMPAVVMRFNEDSKIWERVIKRKVLDIPNTYQVWPDFIRSWMYSLLLTGNTYVLRVLDKDRFVTALYVLDPRSVKPLVTPTGEVYYQLSSDNLSQVVEPITVPASFIIHDRINTLWHPLCGVSPLYASGISAMQGLAMQENSAKFFQNFSRPGGILTAPGHISEDSAKELKAYWETEFSGESAGKIAVVGDGLKYESMTMSAVDSQLIEQLKFSGEMICATFHVPSYKLNLGVPPSVGNLSALNQAYYDQCLHPLVDPIERRLDIGLDLFYPEQVWFDTSELLRMDPAARWDTHTKKIASGAVAPNEVRRDENLTPVEGGETPYLQQQNYSLGDLALRSKQAHEKSGRGDDTAIQTLAMNGGQVASLLSLISAAAAGDIPAETARASIAVAFPSFTSAELDAIIGPLDDFEPTPEPTPAPPVADPATPPEPPEPNDPEATDEELAGMAEIIKACLEARV